MEMYVSDGRKYPLALGGGPPFETWADRLAPYNPISWTNAAWHCPAFIAEGGKVIWRPPAPEGGAFKVSNSYAYNAKGMWGNYVVPGRPLGLNDFNLAVPENRVVAPSEMYEIGDTRPVKFPHVENGAFVAWHIWMYPWQILPRLRSDAVEAEPPHARGYNLLFVDGHVKLVKRGDYLYPPRTAQNWNRDHQAHPELWAATSDWCVQN